VAGLSGAVVPAADARLYNYEDLPVGTRSSGLGNTGMALTDDVGVVYYNPAVISWSEGDQFSAGASAYSRIDTRTGEYVSLFQSAADNVTRGGFLSVPAMVGGFFAKGAWNWGGAVLVPNSFVSSGSLELGPDSSASFESSFEDIWINAFGSYRLNERSSFGLGLFYVSRSSSEKFSYYIKDSGTIDIDFVEKTWEVNGVVAVLGYSHRQSDRWIWGVSARTPVAKIGGMGKISNVSSGASDFETSRFDLTTYPMPIRLSAGMAYSWNVLRTFTLDLHVYAPFKRNLHPDGLADFEVDMRWVPSLHFGYEHFFKKSLGVRMGYFTNLSSATKVPEGISATHDRVNMYGATGALVLAKDSGEVSLGGWAQGGQGRARSVDPEQEGDVPRSNYFYGAVISSTYRF
jgi:hypothetical protein